MKNLKTKSKRATVAVGSDGSGSTFQRELRYIVVKLTDANKYLSPGERDILETLASKCGLGRIDDGKRPLECVCVESDWPEYGPTWAAIERRVATPIETIESLERALGGDGIKEMRGRRCVYYWDDCRGQGSGLDVEVRVATEQDEELFRRLEKRRERRRSNNPHHQRALPNGE